MDVTPEERKQRMADVKAELPNTVSVLICRVSKPPMVYLFGSEEIAEECECSDLLEILLEERNIEVVVNP